MNSTIRKIALSLPRFVKRSLLRRYEDYYAFKAVKSLNLKIDKNSNRPKNNKPHVLFYDIGGMGHGGTSKYSQILAKYLNKEKYDVYSMYSSKPPAGKYAIVCGKGDAAGRLPYFKNTGIHLIDFDYNFIEDKYPYIIRGMKPSIFDIIKENNIDLLIIMSAGYSYFPFNLVRNIPLIMLNIFGSYFLQKNIVYNVCYSEVVARKTKEISDADKIKMMVLPCERPTEKSKENGELLREKLGIAETDMVFGRIGRAVDDIFDPIGIRAFQKVVKDEPGAHYLIMSPPPILEKIVKEEKIPNVHFLPPTSGEEEVWAFHQANDAMAHFRRDGETFGLNIAEAMMAGKPIISHKSFMWNAHLEYLDDSFSRVAAFDNVEQYADYMKEFIELKKNGKLAEMGNKAKEKAEKLFSIENLIGKFEKLVDSTLLYKAK